MLTSKHQNEFNATIEQSIPDQSIKACNGMLPGVTSLLSLRVIGGVSGQQISISGLNLTSSNPVEYVVLRWVRLEPMAYAALGR